MARSKPDAAASARPTREVEIVAEDLGTVPDFVRASLKELQVPGFRVFRWERLWHEKGHPFRDPADYPPISVATSGTHDTDPLIVWWEELPADERERVSALPAGKVSTVGYRGKLYYVYPTATKNRILVGNQTQYNAYKQALVAYGVTTSPDFVEETHGPHRILIQEFDGFGPLGE